MSGIQLTIFWDPPRVWVTSPAMPVVAHALSSRLQMPVLHCCCSWWSSHGTGISKTLHDLFNGGPTIATVAAPSPMAFHGLSCNWRPRTEGVMQCFGDASTMRWPPRAAAVEYRHLEPRGRCMCYKGHGWRSDPSPWGSPEDRELDPRHWTVGV